MLFRTVPFKITTDSGGGFTSTAAAQNRLRDPLLLYAVNWVDIDFDAGVDAVLSVTDPVTAQETTLMTLSNQDAEAWHYPRVPEDDTLGADIATYCMHLVVGTLKLVVTNGGNVKTGYCVAYLLEAS